MGKVYFISLILLIQSSAAFAEMPCIKVRTMAPCSLNDKSDPSQKQILLIPTGYTAEQKSVFETDARRFLLKFTQAPAGVYSFDYKNYFTAYIGWKEGGALGENAAFGGVILPHPVRATSLSMNLESVYSYVEELKTTNEYFSPSVVVTIYNSEDRSATPNATTPTFSHKPYGIAKMTRAQINSAYVPTHELGHAMLNFLDEYVEEGLENFNIHSLDRLTFGLLLNGKFSGFKDAFRKVFKNYDVNISEILIANGSDNVDVTEFPDRVPNPNGDRPFSTEGAMFFGRGAFHESGKNLMDDDHARGPQDGFAFAHTDGQKNLIQEYFMGTDAHRPNNRIRSAGPNGFLKNFELGRTVDVVFFDADKFHMTHPTEKYEVELTYCIHKIKRRCDEPSDWRKFKLSNIEPHATFLDVRGSFLMRVGSFLTYMLCGLGVEQIGGINVCSMSLEGMAEAFLPTLRFPMPYETVEIPTSKAFTKYFWRFRTYNGTHHSGWTSWQHLYRMF